MKGRRIITPEELQQQVLEQLHSHHFGIENTRFLGFRQNTIKHCSTCLAFQQIQPKEKIIHHEIPGKSWKVIRADIFSLNNKHYLCLVAYHAKFPVKRKTGSLILMCEIIFVEYGLPKI